MIKSQKQLFSEMMKNFGVSRPVFVDHESAWIDTKLVLTPMELHTEHSIGRYRLNLSDTTGVQEFWFDIEATHYNPLKPDEEIKLLTKEYVNKCFPHVKDAVKKLVKTMIFEAGIPKDKIYIRASGSFFHVTFFLRELKNEEQWKNITNWIINKAGLENTDPKKRTSFLVGIDKNAAISVKRKLREYASSNKDKYEQKDPSKTRTDYLNYCTYISVDDFNELKTYPFCDDPKKVKFPPKGYEAIDVPQTLLKVDGEDFIESANNMNSRAFMDRYVEKFEDFDCMQLKENIPQWNMMMPWSKLSDEMKLLANSRKIRKDELVLDIEIKDKQDYIDTQERMKKDNVAFDTWESGGRGHHIHAGFPELQKYDDESVSRIKKYLIKKYNKNAEDKKSGQVEILIERSHHRKTGKLKTLILHMKGSQNNKLPKDALDFAQKNGATEYKPQTTDDDYKDYLTKDPLFLYFINNRVDQENMEKNNVVFKNIAAGLIRSGIDKEGMRRAAKIVASNCKGHSSTEITGWIINFQKKKKLPEINKIELNKWIEKHNLNIQKYNTSQQNNVKTESNIKIRTKKDTEKTFTPKPEIKEQNNDVSVILNEIKNAFDQKINFLEQRNNENTSQMINDANKRFEEKFNNLEKYLIDIITENKKLKQELVEMREEHKKEFSEIKDKFRKQVDFDTTFFELIESHYHIHPDLLHDPEVKDKHNKFVKAYLNDIKKYSNK